MLFRINKKGFSEIKEEKYDLEKTLQSLVEDNIQTIFGIDFIATEFQLNGLRLDTIAFDNETNSFIIIEYKRDKSFSVIDQGYAYLSLLLNNKAEFLLQYHSKFGIMLNKKEVSWSETKVIFIANSFTIHQKNAINFRDLPIELREAKKYNGNIYSFNQIRANRQIESVNIVSKTSPKNNIINEIKTYSIEDHFTTGTNKSQILYQELSEYVLSLDERIEEHPTKVYIAFRIGLKNVFAIKVRKAKLVLELLRVKVKDMNDPENKLTDRENAFRHYNKHITLMNIHTNEDIQYGVLMIKQLLKKFFG